MKTFNQILLENKYRPDLIIEKTKVFPILETAAVITRGMTRNRILVEETIKGKPNNEK
tara:strand:+ start:673 stop:846 length:174 start_codon:yes stop_codon:yes gene_type:complete